MTVTVTAIRRLRLICWRTYTLQVHCCSSLHCSSYKSTQRAHTSTKANLFRIQIHTHILITHKKLTGTLLFKDTSMVTFS